MVEIIGERIQPVYIEEEMKSSYLDYAMSVIIGRALPDVRDGLKPVHRRILYAMKELGNTFDKPYKKSARIVGEVLGKYHPHGDMAVYDTLVRMVQEFSLRYPLVDGQGNFGSIDGDNPAAMRYTEVRMNKIGEELLKDIEKNTVEFIPNFDGSLKEPTILPSKFPTLLVNGSSGIAVGMAANIPPHNLCEVVDGIIRVIDNPTISVSELMEVIKGPDFPTGGYICGKKGIETAYSTGRGTIKLRAKTEIEKVKGKERIIITELPYQVNKAKLIERIAEMVREKKIEGISDLRDESDREGMRVVIELKKDANSELVLNQLYTHTSMETTFGIINLALAGKEPKVLTLKDTIVHYIHFREEIVRRRCEFELETARKRLHILEGIEVAIKNIETIIEIIKKESDVQSAKSILMEKFKLTEAQGTAILEMKLQRLTSLEREKVKKESSELMGKIKELEEVLAKREKILGIIKEELREIKEKYGDTRRTEILPEVAELEIEDLIPKKQVAVIITKGGYIKRMDVDEYRQQHRGGKGVIGVETKENDIVADIIITSTHNYLLFFSKGGKVYWLKVHRVPSESRQAKGKAIINLLGIKDELTANIPISKFTSSEYLLMITKNGMIKRTELIQFQHPRKSGIKSINLREDDHLIDVKYTKGNMDVILGTKNGFGIRFLEAQVRVIGRGGMGVRGIKLCKGDEVIGATICEPDSSILTITANGFGKRTKINEYRAQRRGGKGITNIKVTEKTGPVVDIKAVKETDEIIVISSGGKVIRIPVKEISEMGRRTMGVKVMRLDEGEKVVGVEKILRAELT